MGDLESRLAGIRRLGIDGPDAGAAAEQLEGLADELQARLRDSADGDPADAMTSAGVDATS